MGMGGMGDQMGIEALSDDDYGGGDYGEPSLPEGVTKEILVPAASDKWKKPAKDDVVSVHYVGTLADGSEFDSSVKRGKPFEFNLGAGDVIKGWDVGVATMKEGEKAKFTFAPEFAYGAEGSPPQIPANATLTFEIELLSWVNRNELTPDGGIVRLEKVAGSWKTCKVGQEVELDVVGRLEDGTEVSRFESLVYTVGGEGQMGLPDATVEKFVNGMAKGQQVEVQLAPEYGFGAQGGLGGKVPGGAKLKYDVTLKQIYEVDECGLFHDKGGPSVSKKCLVEGDGYETPKDFAQVTAVISAGPIGGAASAPATFAFEVGKGEHCEAVEVALLKMKAKEKAVVTCSDAQLCVDPKLKVNGPAEFTITLESFTQSKQTWDMGNGEKVTHGEKLKAQAAAFFKQQQNRRALNMWKQCQDLFSYTDKWEDEDKKAAETMTAACKLNSAQAWLNLGQHAEAEKVCDEVLSKQSSNVKALYRRGLARLGKNDAERAKYDLQKVIDLEPGNAAAKRELAKANQKIKQDEKRQQGLFKNMMSGLGKGPIPPPAVEKDKLPLGGADDDGLSDDGLDAEP